jgi:hypothetical protein
VWVAVVVLALLSRRGALGVGVPARVSAPRPTLRAARLLDRRVRHVATSAARA